MHKGMVEYIGNPVVSYRAWPPGNWDSLKLDKTAGHYMICDKHGYGIKWIDTKDDMIIKIRAKLPHYKGYKYLQADSQGTYSKYNADHKVYVQE